MKKSKITSLVSIAILLLAGKLVSQNTVAFSLTSQVTANGYGTQYIPSLIFTHGQSSVSAGVSIPKGKAQVAGMRLRYEYTVTGKVVNDSANDLELFFFANGAYYYNGSLGKRTTQQENMVNPDLSMTYLNGMKFSSVELYAGAGLRIPFLNRFKWVNCVGVGYYHSLSECGKLYRDPNGVGLFLSTGLWVRIL